MKTYIAVFALALLVSCEHRPAPLIGGVYSCASIESAYNTLKLINLDVDTVENSGLKKGDKRPPFSIFTIEFDYVDLGVRGRLRLSFFNGQLASSSFYPLDFNLYVAKLKEAHGINLIDKAEVSKEGARIWRYTDYKGRKYLGSEDQVLEEEMTSWIRRYS